MSGCLAGWGRYVSVTGLPSSGVGYGMTVGDLLARLQHVRPGGEGRWTALCPGHEDHSHSLGITAGRRRWFLKCFAGCTEATILQALGLGVPDAFYEPAARPIAGGNGGGGQVVPLSSARAKPGQRRTPVAWYNYRDPESGQDTHRKVRYQPKSFSWEHWEDGRWVPGGMPHFLYQLDQLAGASVVWWCAGEKDADRVHGLLAADGLGAATTNPEGETGGREDYGDQVRRAAPDCQVVILPLDHDLPGYARVAKVAPCLWRAGLAVVLVTFQDLGQPGADISDWLDQGRDILDLLRYVDRHGIPWTQDLADSLDAVALPFHTTRALPAHDPGLDPEPQAAWVSKLEDPVVLLSREHPPRVPLVDGLLPSSGFTVWSGRAKSYKSTLALYVSLALALGLDQVCGRKVNKRQRVLFLEEEDPEDRTQERIRGMLQALTGKSWSDDETGAKLRSHFRWRSLGGYRMDMESWPDLEQELDHWPPDILVFDAARKLTREQDFIDPRVLHGRVDQLQALSIARRLSFWLIAHDRKGPPGENKKGSSWDAFDLDAIAGGLHLQAEADVVIRLVRFGKVDVQLMVRSKDEEALGPYRVRVTKDQSKMAVDLDDIQDLVDKGQAKGAANRAQVLAALRNCPETPGSLGGRGVAQTDLATYCGMSVKTVSKHLEALLTEGLIVESGRTHQAGGKRGKPLRLFSVNRFQADLTDFPSGNSREPGEDDT